jgi:hypothetical protein
MLKFLLQAMFEVALAPVKKALYRLFHRRHVFKMEDVIRDDRDPHCTQCGRALSTLKSARGTLVALLFLASLARPDSFVGAKTDSVFYFERAYRFEIVIENALCFESSPCLFQIDEGGLTRDQVGTYHGSPGDTVSLSYGFPARRFKPDTRILRLALWDAFGRSLGGWIIRVEYFDPVPTLSRDTDRPKAPTARTLPRLDGRVF